VAVHVRRGDFEKLGNCICSPEYYLSSIEYITKKIGFEKPHIYFFSNGMDWVKEHITNKLPSNIEYSFIENNDNDSGFIDLYLISQCTHQISSNSSFGIWGGLLNQNKNKIVVIPDRWYAKTNRYNLGSEEAHHFPDWVIIPIEGKKSSKL
jgi:hypothetical protein